MLNTILQDIRYALRQLRNAPGFALTAILTLALGIGINAAMFTVIDAVLLHRLPVPHPAQIVSIGEADAKGNPGISSLPDLRDWRAQMHTLQDIGWYTLKFFNLQKPDGSVDFAFNIQTSENFFTLLQAQPLLGRTFDSRDSQPDGRNVVVLSYFVWKNYFQSDRGILGKQVSWAIPS